MANVTFHVGNNAPGSSGLTTGGLYINKTGGGIYYATSSTVATPIATLVEVTPDVSSGYGSAYKIATISTNGVSTSIYGKRVEYRDIYIGCTVPISVGDMCSAYCTISESEIGSYCAFIGYSVEGWADIYNTGTWSFKRGGVTVGSTSSGGIASYKLTATVTADRQATSGTARDGEVIFRIYYIKYA